MTSEEETASTHPMDDPDLQKLYQATALDGKWKDMLNNFINNRKRKKLLEPLSLYEDTAFHIAAYSSQMELLQALLGHLESSEILEALTKENSHGNNVFHEVATTNKVEAAELLIRKLRDTDVNINPEVELRGILKRRNQLGETPLFRAAAIGRTKMLNFLAKKVGNDLSPHFKRKNEMSILHIAVIGQHLETAAWLLRKDRRLGERKGKNGVTCLDLLAKMPSAFRSSCSMGIMERFLYKCLPAHAYQYDDDGDSNNDELSPNTVKSNGRFRERPRHQYPPPM